VRLNQFAVDDSTHNRDGLVLHGWDRAEMVTAFISRRVMDDWSIPGSPMACGEVSFASNTTLSANAIFQRSNGLSHPSINVVWRSTASTHSWMFCYPTITDSCEVLDTSELMREPPLPTFRLRRTP